MIWCSSIKRMAILSFALSLNSWVNCEEVIVRTPSGESLTVEVGPNDPFIEVMQKIQAGVAEVSNSHETKISNPFVIDFMCPGVENVRASVFSDDVRVYNGPISDDQLKDLRYILKSMATKTWADLLKARNKMNRAGDNLDSIHPLNFLACIFKSEELKGCLHSIRDRKQIWDNFFEGLERSLQEESQRDNMRHEHVQHFASNLGINADAIKDHVNQRRWEDLVVTLLKLLPRQGNPGRYDM